MPDTNKRKTQDTRSEGTDEEIFDHEFLGRLRKLFFKLRKRRRLRNKGIQNSPVSGFTQEFKDRRQYAPGDDFRAIDWRLYARMEKLFIRIFEEVQEFHIHILTDRSGSMVQPFAQKRVCALQLSVALAYLGLVNEHRVSLMSFGDDIRRELPPLKGQGHIYSILEHMSGLEFGGVTQLTRSLQHFKPHRDRRGIIFVVSDLFGSHPGESEGAIRQAISWPVETHVIQVLHPREIEPDLEGEIQLVDVETNEARRMRLSRKEMHRYREAVQAYMDKLERECLRREINYYPWQTDQPFEDMFLQLLSRGSALAGD